jgi:hypothetical protein
LGVSVQNFVRIGSAYRFLIGEVIMAENEFAFIPMFAPSEASSCGLFTEDGRLVGIVQSTYDTANAIEISGDVYSAREVVSLFVKALLTNSRHDPVLSRVLICAQVLEMFRTNPATIENPRESEVLRGGGSVQRYSTGSSIGKGSSSTSTPDSKNVARDRTANEIRDGEVVEIFTV